MFRFHVVTCEDFLFAAMEDEKDFVPDYNEEVSEDEEELLIRVECSPGVSDPAVAGSSAVVEVVVEGKVDRKVTWEEGPAPAGPVKNPCLVSPRYFVREDLGPFPGPGKVRGSSECLECGLRTTHMKRHVVQYHIANHFWQVIPMMVCWLCRQFETPAVIKQHSGMFVVENHVGEFVRGVDSFFQFLYSEMGISSEEELLRFVWINEILMPTSSFSTAEVQALDAYDRATGTPHLPVRAAFSPERLSSLLHWRTVHHLLLRCDPTRVPKDNFQMEIPNDHLAITIPSSTNSVTTRSVEFRGKTLPTTPPRAPTKSSKKSKKRKSSVVFSLPGEINCSTPLFDTHCHLDRLFRKTNHHGGLFEYLTKMGRGVSSSFKGCNAVFCDPPQLLTPHSVEHFLLEEGVYGVVGCHPKWAHRFTGPVKARIVELLQHPKVVALGEVGLDFSGRISKKEKAIQRDVLKELLDIAAATQKPIVFHSRDAGVEVVSLAKPLLRADHPIHMHCCIQEWSEIMTWKRTFSNVIFGVTAACTDPQKELAQHCATLLPLSSLVLETDSPYFLPHDAPAAIEYSDPQMVLRVAQEVAALQHVSVDRVLQSSWDNATRVYGF